MNLSARRGSGNWKKELSPKQNFSLSVYETLPADRGDFVSGLAQKECPLLKECDFGDFENKNYKELSGNPDYQAWIDSGGALPFPGGEDPEGFRNRCRGGLCPMCGGSLCHGKSGNGHRRSRRYYYEYPQRLWISENRGILTGR